MPSPQVAVVIATHERETRLRFALEAIAAQTLDRDCFELIVVRAPQARGPFATAPEGLEVSFTAAAGAGPAAQRNHGWRAACAPLVAFTDDDCRPQPGWLEALLACSGPGAIVQGRTRPDPDERHLLGGLARSMDVEGPSEWFPSCNIAYPRRLLERVGGFDESFRSPWGEDTDLGLRASAAGAELRYAPEALVEHAVLSRSPLAAAADARRRRWLALVIARHPEQRRALYRRVFANRAHAAVAAGIAMAIGSRSWPALAALAPVPFVAHNLAFNLGRGIGTPSGVARFAAQMPARLAIDLIEIAAALEGSVRHRSLVI